MYEEKKTFDVLNGTVPEFMNGDIMLAFTINNQKISNVSFPNKNEGYTKNSITCEEGVQAEWDDTNWALKVVNSNNQSKIRCTIDFNAPTLATYLKSKITSVADGESGFIKQEHDATEQTGTFAQTDYRFIGANPNNYICLEDGQCTEDNLYRIIGVIPTQSSDSGNYEDRVKLIKNTYYAGDTSRNTFFSTQLKGYDWSGSKDNQSNDWTKSTLNTQVLNSEYWNRIQNYQNYIEKAKWYLGGAAMNDTSSEFYNEERGKDIKSKEFIIAPVGLLYASDYGFANSLKTCLDLSIREWKADTNCKNYDWLKSDDYEWTITSMKNSANIAFDIDRLGYIFGNFVASSLSSSIPENGFVYLVKPSFYLKANVLYKNGKGTIDNPYTVNIK